MNKSLRVLLNNLRQTRSMNGELGGCEGGWIDEWMEGTGRDRKCMDGTGLDGTGWIDRELDRNSCKSLEVIQAASPNIHTT